MTKHEELRELAVAANVIDHNEQRGWYDEECLLEMPIHYPKNARFIAAASPTSILELLDRQDRLEALITKLHAAKGRYHSQQAACDLFDAVGLKNERPVK